MRAVIVALVVAGCATYQPPVKTPAEIEAARQGWTNALAVRSTINPAQLADCRVIGPVIHRESVELPEDPDGRELGDMTTKRAKWVGAEMGADTVLVLVDAPPPHVRRVWERFNEAGRNYDSAEQNKIWDEMQQMEWPIGEAYDCPNEN